MFRGPANLTPIYSVDFAALATTAKFTDGPGATVIDGKSWNVENAASADTFQITNGTGLVIDPSAANTGMWATRNAPIISIKYGNISSVLGSVWSPEIVVVVSFTHSLLDANFEQVRLQHERYLGGGTAQESAYIARIFSSGAKWEIGVIRSNVVTNFVDTNTTNDDVMAYYVQAGGQIVNIYTGVTTAGALPAVTGLTRRAVFQQPTPTNVSSADDFAICLTAFPVNTNNAFNAAFKKLAVYAVL